MGKLVVATDSGAVAIEMLRACVAVCCGVPESAACTVKLNGLPVAVVGVPLITPVLAFSVKPGGSDPKVMLQVIGAMPPPFVCSVWLYSVLTVPLASDVVLMASTGLMLMVSALVAVCCGVPESVACTVKFDMPLGPVGVPVIAPVAAFSVRPAGREPTVIAQVTAGVPPLEESVAE